MICNFGDTWINLGDILDKSGSKKHRGIVRNSRGGKRVQRHCNVLRSLKGQKTDSLSLSLQCNVLKSF